MEAIVVVVSLYSNDANFSSFPSKNSLAGYCNKTYHLHIRFALHDK